MIFLTKFLIILYAILMAIAALASYQQLPLWLTGLNTVTGVLTILFCLTGQKPLTISLLVGFLFIALANGYFLHQKVNWSHWLIRLLLTGILIWLNWHC